MSAYPPEIAAKAFALRRLDRKTIKQTGRLLGIPWQRVDEVVRQHMEHHGIVWQQQSCGQRERTERRIQQLIALHKAGALPEEIRIILGYASTENVRERLRRYHESVQPWVRGHVISHKQVNPIPALEAPKSLIAKVGWSAGQEVSWWIGDGLIWLDRDVEEDESFRLTQGDLSRAETTSGRSADSLTGLRIAYQRYVLEQAPIRIIATELSVTQATVVNRAERYARLCSLPFRGRWSQSAKSGTVRISAKGRLSLFQPVARLRWPIGSDVLYRAIDRRRVAIELFDLNAVRESLGI